MDDEGVVRLVCAQALERLRVYNCLLYIDEVFSVPRLYLPPGLVSASWDAMKGAETDWIILFLKGGRVRGLGIMLVNDIAANDQICAAPECPAWKAICKKSLLFP